ncbi:MAG: hypothetical protein KJP03_03665, partial [Gammaproteobacteria bacterium]|nr:hypothetical protein [Gammaproteobacteria bacterium]
SDHDGLVLFIKGDEDGDGVPNNLDLCAGTALPESTPTQRLGRNRWALTDGDGVFDTNVGNPGLSFTLGDTAGCSCEQIIEELDLGKGQVKFGCSTGNMRTWVNQAGD